MSNFESTMTTVYDRSANLGVFEGTLKLICGMLIALICLIIGIVLFTKNQSNLVNSVATVIDAHCSAQQQGRSSINVCYLKIKYVVDGRNYTGAITTSGSNMYSIGSNVDITYDSKNPLNVQSKIIRDKTIAYILIGIGLCIGVCVYVNYYMTTHYKMYAAAEGFGDAIRIL